MPVFDRSGVPHSHVLDHTFCPKDCDKSEPVFPSCRQVEESSASALFPLLLPPLGLCVPIPGQDFRINQIGCLILVSLLFPL